MQQLAVLSVYIGGRICSMQQVAVLSQSSSTHSYPSRWTDIGQIDEDHFSINNNMLYICILSTLPRHCRIHFIQILPRSINTLFIPCMLKHEACNDTLGRYQTKLSPAAAGWSHIIRSLMFRRAALAASALHQKDVRHRMQLQQLDDDLNRCVHQQGVKLTT